MRLGYLGNPAHECPANVDRNSGGCRSGGVSRIYQRLFCGKAEDGAVYYYAWYGDAVERSMPAAVSYTHLSVIDKPLSKRMASTVRHNRARGSHDVDLMSNIIKELHEIGRSDAWISKHLGMDKDEILRLKQITGLTALFRDCLLYTSSRMQTE